MQSETRCKTSLNDFHICIVCVSSLFCYLWNASDIKKLRDIEYPCSTT